MGDEDKRKLASSPTVELVRKPSAREREWEEKTLNPALAKSPDRAADFTTVSSYSIHRLYTEADLAGWDPHRDQGVPGEPPSALPAQSL